ncbi:MAG: hypothetical protein AB7D49_08980 [Arcobacter sp.]|uniref:Uncharacterized protein n=1 Tax=Arcobacter defluvii TaxID=873191 RepID=A0AAE7BFD3_9BACT|nr:MULTISPECIES: hypothetical protein [Arcobacter]QKF76784.1 hypothetical protein ADFLV_0735 [Arcobacter defluvii]RXI34925.1 hypothetical protein CP964_02160 [Arcobacter defluvii]
MSKTRRQSLIVNNFFTLASIVMISVTMILYSKFIVGDKEITKEEVIPLSCEKDIFSTSKVFNQKLLNDSQKALNKGFYKIQGEYIKSKYSKSIIEEFISLDEIDSFYKNSIQVNPKNDINKFLTIDYEIIENDKKDPNKKSKECKICSGSIMTSFKADKTEIFRFYIDFNLYDKDEIKRRIDCTIKAYKNNVKKI